VNRPNLLVPGLERQAPPQPRLRWRSLTELAAEPPACDVVAGILPDESVNMLYGRWGTGKTFMAIDMAMCVATGTAWHGHDVLPGQVAYIAAEGQRRLVRRFESWCIAHERPLGDWVALLLEPYPLLDRGALERLVTDLQVISCCEEEDGTVLSNLRLLVIDTARAMIDASSGDENRVLGNLVTHCQEIAHELRCAVLLVHHPGIVGSRPRGDTGGSGAVDTILRLEEKAGIITLRSEKVRDDAPFNPERFTLEPVGESLVLRPLAEDRLGALLTPNDLKALEALKASVVTDGLLATAWHQATGLPQKSFYRARKRLVNMGLVRSENKRYRPRTSEDSVSGMNEVSIQCQTPRVK
jgi:hypothetical protein